MSRWLPWVLQEQTQGCPSGCTAVQRQQVPQEGGRDRGMAENSPKHSSSHRDCAEPSENPDSSTQQPRLGQQEEGDLWCD